jgi:hypothetical protein
MSSPLGSLPLPPNNLSTPQFPPTSPGLPSSQPPIPQNGGLDPALLSALAGGQPGGAPTAPPQLPQGTGGQFSSFA